MFEDFTEKLHFERELFLNLFKIFILNFVLSWCFSKMFHWFHNIFQMESWNEMQLKIPSYLSGCFSCIEKQKALYNITPKDVSIVMRKISFLSLEKIVKYKTEEIWPLLGLRSRIFKIEMKLFDCFLTTLWNT